jgi:RNA polymerase sigma-70 factor, ECF subfamily
LVNSASVSGSQREAPALPVGNLSESRERALVLSHFAAVWRALRRFGLSAADADDAAQQVFLAAVPRVGEILPNRERAFLCGIAANVAKKARRSLARRREQLSDVETHIDPQPTSEDLLERRQARLLLDRMLEALEHDVRVVFVLHEIEELTAPEIAEALAIPLGTVASRLRRGREQFARGLARYRARTKGRK